MKLTFRNDTKFSYQFNLVLSFLSLILGVEIIISFIRNNHCLTHTYTQCNNLSLSQSDCIFFYKFAQTINCKYYNRLILKSSSRAILILSQESYQQVRLSRSKQRFSSLTLLFELHFQRDYQNFISFSFFYARYLVWTDSSRIFAKLLTIISILLKISVIYIVK